MSYKAAKEAFVAGHTGTSLMDVQLVSCIGVVSYALYSASRSPQTKCSPLRAIQSSPILDYTTSFLPLLLAQTTHAPSPIRLNLALFSVILILLILNPSKPSHRPHRASTKPSRSKSKKGTTTTSPSPPSPPSPISYPRQPFLSVYRAHMMAMTVIAILAVDFPIFPRSFGKTETWGTSLMDVGVGSFVFSLGIVSARAVLKGEAAEVNSDTAKGDMKEGKRGDGEEKKVPGTAGQLWKAARKAMPLFALGMVRVVMVKGVEYPEHITEYGVHWNFFFTLAAMPFVLPVAQALRRVKVAGRPIPFSVLATTLSSLWELLLKARLQAWVLSPDRAGLLAMNKEGLVSLPGYIAIFLLGVDTGCYVLPPTPFSASTVRNGKVQSGNGKPVKREAKKTLMVLCGYAVLWWVALGVLRLLEQPVSRRMANLPYVLWIAAYNATYLAGYLAVELWFFPGAPAQAVPPLLEAINKNSLALFLLANLMTGVVNLSVKTMYTPTLQAMGILVAYTAVFSLLAWALRRIRIAI